MAFENDIPPRNYRLPRRNVIFQTPSIVGRTSVRQTQTSEPLALLMAFENDILPRNCRLPPRNVIFQTPSIVGRTLVRQLA